MKYGDFSMKKADTLFMSVVKHPVGKRKNSLRKIIGEETEKRVKSFRVDQIVVCSFPRKVLLIELSQMANDVLHAS